MLNIYRLTSTGNIGTVASDEIGTLIGITLTAGSGDATASLRLDGVGSTILLEIKALIDKSFYRFLRGSGYQGKTPHVTLAGTGAAVTVEMDIV